MTDQNPQNTNTTNELHQRIYDTVKSHLLNQMKQSKDSLGDCRYRGDNGTKCAIGALIKDEYYDPTLEGITPHYEEVAEAVVLSLGVEGGFSYRTREFLTSLQEVHDDHIPEEWEDNLRRVARLYNLNA